MEIQLQHKIKKAETEKIPIPNLKSNCLLPTKIKFSVQDLEFTLLSLNNPLLRYGESYFRVFNEIDLADYKNKIAEGEDLTMTVKNLGKKELILGITIVYEKQVGNVIYFNSYYSDQINFDKCLDDISNAGQVTQLILDADQPISSVVLDPIYKLTPNQEQTTVDLAQFSNWSSALAIQNSKPTTRIIIDFTDKDLENYIRYLKFYRLKVITVEGETKDKQSASRIHLIGFGFKSDKR